MKQMKNWVCLLAALLLVSCASMAYGLSVNGTPDSPYALNDAYAQQEEETVEEEAEPQFPFLAETSELAVNVRQDMSTKARRVGRLERGSQLTVLSAQLNDAGEMWYAVALDDGTQGYIRSDLLIPSEELAIQRAAYATPEPETAAEKLIGNSKTKKYHETWCGSLPDDKNRVYFSSAKEAEGKGYVHCKKCD